MNYYKFDVFFRIILIMNIKNKILNELPEDIILKITKIKQKENLILRMCFIRWNKRAFYIKLMKKHLPNRTIKLDGNKLFGLPTILSDYMDLFVNYEKYNRKIRRILRDELNNTINNARNNTNDKNINIIITNNNNNKINNYIKKNNKIYNKKYNNRIKYNRNRNCYPIKDTYRK